MSEESLDLEGRLRPGLDILAAEIVIGLKKRLRFPQNPEIYRPGLVRGDPEQSLLRYTLARMEQVHAELGRFTYASQQAFSDVSGVPLIIQRTAPPSPIMPFENAIGSRVTSRYIQWVEEHCPPGSDSDSFGESVTADVDALLSIQQRINLGLLVAESKFRASPDAYVAAKDDPARIRSMLVNKDREARVLQAAERLAHHYEVDPAAVTPLFEWMIAMTVEVEVSYLRMRGGQGATGG